MSSAALAQLMEMGIPRARATPALARAKGDVMAAAERVFSGEFDDIPSDNEDGASQAGSVGEGSAAVSDGEGGNEAYDYDDDDDIEGTPNGHSTDPYAGIFFSKDRVEEITEVSDEPIKVGVKVGSKVVQRDVLTRSTWMSGCPEGNEQSFLFQLYSMLSEGDMPCSSGCGHTFRRRHADFFTLHPTFAEYIDSLTSVIQTHCPSCAQTTCFACGAGISTATSSKSPYAGSSKAATRGSDALYHCANIQGVIMGVGLYMIQQTFDELHSVQDKVATSSRKRKPDLASKFRPLIKPDPDDEYDSDDEYAYGPLPGGKSGSKGTGYSGNANEDLARQEEQRRLDARAAAILSHVRPYLPSFSREGGPRTQFFGELLRNDSLFDMSNRSDLYTELLHWLEIISSHEALASMLAMPRMNCVSVTPGPAGLRCRYEGAESPRELLEKVVIQAEAALRVFTLTAEEKNETEEDLQKSKEEYELELARLNKERLGDDGQLKAFCERIVTAARNIDRSLAEVKGDAFMFRLRQELPSLGGSKQAGVTDDKAPSSIEDAKATYEAWAVRARFDYCDMSYMSDGKLWYKHAFKQELGSLEKMNAPKRSLAIAKELAILTTSLPAAWGSTIFLRVDEARVDCVKALIIGPEGTPYQNAPMLFDIFLPLEYNQRCPSVKAVTTNGGRYRYNPNLYADGKVCLSLLGTWSGPGWIPGQSTLLQVLISIQSLILCDEPYLNEPGWASQAGTEQSKAYSANIRRMVVTDAMCNNLKEPPFPYKDVIETHFRLKADEIRRQLDEWKTMDDGLPIYGDGGYHVAPSGAAGEGSKTAFDGAADELRALLGKLAGPAERPPATPSPSASPGRRGLRKRKGKK